jgi:hypothetical protein
MTWKTFHLPALCNFFQFIPTTKNKWKDSILIFALVAEFFIYKALEISFDARHKSFYNQSETMSTANNKNTLILCFNALDKCSFEVPAIHEVDHMYRRYFYRISLRLNFNESDINMIAQDEMRKLCLRKITKLMTTQNMWQNHHSFYVVDYEIRTIAKTNERIQQNNNESDRRVHESENDSHNFTSSSASTSVGSSSSSSDSSYLSSDTNNRNI